MQVSSRPVSRYVLPKAFIGDRFVGAIAILLDTFGIALAVGHPLDDPALRIFQAEGLFGSIALFFFAAAGFVFHVGIFDGRRWGFILTLFLSSLGVMSSLVPGGPTLNLIRGIFLLTYVILRLSRTMGTDFR